MSLKSTNNTKNYKLIRNKKCTIQIDKNEDKMNEK